MRYFERSAADIQKTLTKSYNLPVSWTAPLRREKKELLQYCDSSGAVRQPTEITKKHAVSAS
jgi:hypothetical protein